MIKIFITVMSAIITLLCIYIFRPYYIYIQDRKRFPTNDDY